ncbi:MAG: hypothetical protein F4060_15385 [Holophagales bacterium]|nr:hypothetical protein [Holophagales bacterium]MYG29344.1 hypothetical protein [Holophagales bacterium]MYI81311.1 hypothetical protein [Holophagales bacterium]
MTDARKRRDLWPNENPTEGLGRESLLVVPAAEWWKKVGGLIAGASVLAAVGFGVVACSDSSSASSEWEDVVRNAVAGEDDLRVAAGEEKQLQESVGDFRFGTVTLNEGSILRISDEIREWKLLAERLEVGAGVSIVAAGTDGADGRRGRAGENGRKCTRGTAGATGEPGGEGTNGVTIHIEAVELVFLDLVPTKGDLVLDIDTSGGSGGSGGDGGPGGAGGRGDRSDRCNGGDGGRGGDGADGGGGGNGGNVFLRFGKDSVENMGLTYSTLREILGVDFSGGEPGEPGSGGRGGDGGRGRGGNIFGLSADPGSKGNGGRDGSRGRDGEDGEFELDLCCDDWEGP